MMRAMFAMIALGIGLPVAGWQKLQEGKRFKTEGISASATVTAQYYQEGGPDSEVMFVVPMTYITNNGIEMFFEYETQKHAEAIELDPGDQIEVFYMPNDPGKILRAKELKDAATIPYIMMGGGLFFLFVGCWMGLSWLKGEDPV